MNNDPETRNGIMEKLAGRVTNIVLLGFFGLLFSLPIVTAGAAFSAVNYATKAYLVEGEEKPLRRYFWAFKAFFKTSTLVWLINLAAIAIIVWDFVYYRTGNSTLDILAQAGVFVLAIFLLMEMSLVFVVIPEELAEGVFPSILKALDIAVTCLMQTLMIVTVSVCCIGAVINLLTGFVPILPGLVAYLIWHIIPDMLQKYKFKKGNEQYRRERNGS
ncbi:MAG: YesL family protein [Erysipelotrichaceae bacterium]|nr:YesL family protein [Erysipelotrichaceae bacterium]